MAKKKKPAKEKARKATRPKSESKPSAKRAKKTEKPAAKSRVARPSSWLDGDAEVPVIEQSARRLKSFLTAMADGVVEDAEVKAQEKRLVKLMKEIEPTLDDKTHAAVTKLLCELTAYDLMQLMCAMHKAKSQATKFRG